MQGEKVEEQTEFPQNGLNAKEGNRDKEFNKKASGHNRGNHVLHCHTKKSGSPKRSSWLGIEGHVSPASLGRHCSPTCHCVSPVFVFPLSDAWWTCYYSSSRTTLPALSRVVAWTGLLLEANFALVVTIPEAKGLLLSLYKFVKSQIRI